MHDHRRPGQRHGTLHPVQQAVVDEQGFQCAFCMPGFVMAAVGFFKTNPSPTRQELAHGVSGNLCRCQDYDKILTALMRGAEYSEGERVMAEPKLVGHNYTTPDLVAKVTGRASYAEDFRADGMLFCKLLLSPMPHARVRSIDTSAALAMPGVQGDPHRRRPAAACRNGAERALTNEPVYAGRADPGGGGGRRTDGGRGDRADSTSISSRCRSSIDPLESLRPGGPNARRGNVVRAAPAPGGQGAGRAVAASRR